MKKISNFSKLLIILFFLTSCKTSIKNEKIINDNRDKINQESVSEKEKMEIRFSCGEDLISEYTDDGWEIVDEYSEEKICTWKSFPATKDCNMELDKGCKITQPDKIGEEKIYLLER